MQGLVAKREVEGPSYYAGIDGLRAVAVLFVMLFHLVPAALPGGFVGVDIFFVISGYVVTGSLARDGALSFPRFIAAFYARRLRRILPALVVCLVATVLLSAAFIPQAWLSSIINQTGLSAFFGLSNFVLLDANEAYFAPRSEYNPFTHTWSLAVEEQFYLFVPILLYLGLNRPGSASGRAALWLFVALCLASFGFCIWASQANSGLAYYMLPSRFWELGVGAGACLLGEERQVAIVRRLGQRLVLWGGLLLIVTAAVFSDSARFPFPWAIPAALGSVLLILGIVSGQTSSLVARWLSSSPMVAIGLLSYSLYLWHWPIYALMRWTVGLASLPGYVAALAATAAAAWLFYRLVETPPQIFPPIRRLANWATILVFACLPIGGWIVANEVYKRPALFGQSVVSRNPGDWYPVVNADPAGASNKCSTVIYRTGQEQLRISPWKCADNEDAPSRRLFVIGDSHAAAYERMLQETVRQTGAEAFLLMLAGCGAASFIPHSELKPECRAFEARAARFVLERARPGDIVFLPALRVDRLSDQALEVELLTPRAFLTPAERRRAEKEASQLIGSFTKAGLLTIIDLPKPVFRAPPFRCSDAFNRMNPVCEPGLSVDRAFLEHHRADVVATATRWAGLDPNIHLWDPFPILCPQDPCQLFDGDRPLFFDADHLSGYGNEKLAGSFIEFLDRIDPVRDRLTGQSAQGR